ncbi:hypothetical protein QNM99_11785 [Pseudomonas sp. PCH446]
MRDLDGRLLTCNRSYEERFATTLEQVQGRRITEVDILPRRPRSNCMPSLSNCSRPSGRCSRTPARFRQRPD